MSFEIGVTLDAVLAMPSVQIGVYAEYRRRNGWPSDRARHGTAIAGAAVCQAWGAKVKPEELLPRYASSPAQRFSNTALIAYLSSIPGAKVEYGS